MGNYTTQVSEYLLLCKNKNCKSSKKFRKRAKGQKVQKNILITQEEDVITHEEDVDDHFELHNSRKRHSEKPVYFK